MEFVDLGLPSGTLWASENESGYYNWVDAHWKFGDALPRVLDFMELVTYCKVYQQGKNPGVVRFEGSNGNYIDLPFRGWGANTSIIKAFYWTDTLKDTPGEKTTKAWSFTASPVHLLMPFKWDISHQFARENEFSIRLCKRC